MHDAQNLLFTLASDFISYSSRPVFLTGKAGTGKTTFLKYIREHANKQTAVVAPTGVAAINAGGVTIHSFFQLPFTPYIPASKGFAPDENTMDKHHLLGRIRLNRERREVFQKLELLIIDEISMVRCDVLDAIDVILRSFRNRHDEPYGGVQVLYIGDMFQLPPVAGEDEWNILSSYYRSPYFFDSKVVQEQPPVHIELDKIYRQNEQAFIDVLNKVRNNAMDKAAYELLDKRFDPWFQLAKDDEYIVLTTHNAKADAINIEEITKLKGEAVTYQAKIDGDFNDRSYPVDALLQLKVGAQVMFVKNDVDKRFFNGKIGVVTRLGESSVFVHCKGETNDTEVRQEKWENIRYSVNDDQIHEDVIGFFKQLPLRLAWAITIHKSQGLTFEKAVIDAGASFAAGQVYVALSRCTALQGIVMKSKINALGLRNDERIIQFAQQKHNSDQLLPLLNESKKEYQQDVLLKLFDFDVLSKQASRVMKILEEHATSFNAETKPWFEEVINKLEKQSAIASKFSLVLMSRYFIADEMPEKNTELQSRLKDAFAHFYNELFPLQQSLLQSPAITDSKQIALAYNAELKALYNALSLKLYLINICKKGFNSEVYNAAKKQFTTPSFSLNAYAGTQDNNKVESLYPDLYKQLRQLRDTICAEQQSPIYMVCGSTALVEMSTFLPQTFAELIKITGFGKIKAHQYGQRFLNIINTYCDAHDLRSTIGDKKPKRERKEKSETKKIETRDTKQETYSLFRQQKGIEDIAKIRNLSTITIEGHLTHFVQQGLINIDELVAIEKQAQIQTVLASYDGIAIKPVKDQLDDSITYGEIKFVMAANTFDRSKSASAPQEA